MRRLRPEPEVLRLHGAAGSDWRAASGHCSGCDRLVVPVRPPFSLSPARLALWVGVSLGALVMFGGVALWPALGFILWRNCRAVCPDCGHGPWAGTSAGPGSPSSCGPALLPVSWPPSGGRSTWRCCWPGCSPGRCSAEVRVPGLAFRRPWGGHLSRCRF